MVITKTRRWGNSLGVRIPKSSVSELSLHEDQEIEIEIKPVQNVLKELFGFAKDKAHKPTEQILKEARQDLSKHF